MPAPPSALRLPAEVRARARATRRDAPGPAVPATRARRRRRRALEPVRRTPFPLEALEVD